MFSALSNEERQKFLTQNNDNYIPGYTGHCPTLKFHYGQGYGTRTKAILKDLRSAKVYNKKYHYRSEDFHNPLLKPLEREKGQFKDYALDRPAPRVITGYTGFIPTINFRYGKSYSRSVEDSIQELTNTQRRIKLANDEIGKIYRYTPGQTMTPIRSNDEVKVALNEYVEKNRYKDAKVSAEHPPIAGYTGHIPMVKGNEESLSQRYNTVVKRGFTLLKQQREKFDEIKTAQNKVEDVIETYKNLHPYKHIN